MKEVKFKMGKYSDLIKIFKENKSEYDTIYIVTNKENGQKK